MPKKKHHDTEREVSMTTTTTMTRDEKIAAFRVAYLAALAEAIRKNPEAYDYPADEAEIVVHRMISTMLREGPLSINRDTTAFRAACRKAGVKNTAKDLAAWFAS